MPSDLETPRLRLRPRDGQDAGWNLALLAEHPLAPQPRSVEEEAERLDEQHEQFERAGFGLYTVEFAETDEPVGYCGLIVGRASAAQPELAYELLRAHVGHGYATEAASVVADAAFDAGFPVLWASVESWNAPSFSVLQKLGFSSTRRVRGEGRTVLIWMRRRTPERRHRAAPAAAPAA
jgi:RimJ/RimL family protein N-acetyltransferase